MGKFKLARNKEIALSVLAGDTIKKTALAHKLTTSSVQRIVVATARRANHSLYKSLKRSRHAEVNIHTLRYNKEKFIPKITAYNGTQDLIEPKLKLDQIIRVKQTYYHEFKITGVKRNKDNSISYQLYPTNNKAKSTWWSSEFIEDRLEE